MDKTALTKFNEKDVLFHFILTNFNLHPAPEAGSI